MSQPAGRAEPPLPAGFGLALDPKTRRPRRDVLIGGSPARVLRLRTAGAAQLDAWAAGEPVGPGRGSQRLARRLLDTGIAHPRPGRAAHPDVDDVTVVIPVRDDATGLAATLGAIGRVGQTVVVDDGSLDPAAVRGAAGTGPIQFIRHPCSTGPAAARNTGWQAAQNDLIAFVDAGCEPEPAWLAPLLAHFADPAVGAAAPRVTSAGASAPRWLAAYERRRSPLDLGPTEATVRPGSPVPYVPTATLVVRASALADGRGFDEALRFGEDVDLVWRLGKRGWRVRYEPAATVAHPARRGLGAWLRQRHQYGRSAAPLAARHGRAVAPVSVSPWSATAWGLVACGHPFVGAGLAAASTAVLARRAGRDRDTARSLARLGIGGHLRAGAMLAAAVRRAWLPPALVTAAMAARRGWRAPAWAIGAAFVLPIGAEWVTDHSRQLGLLRWTALRLADDLAYQSGVWAGVIRARSPAALLPDW